ncbi:MAG: phytoene desaturase family protein [Bacteroidia bacterium]|jgi:phytoene desaturase
MTRKALVIGAGFSGISAATALASRGFEVKILEKHSGPGGRARQFKDSGYTFDMGPSWYWMPDVFEKYFSWYGHSPSDFYSLKRLDPSYCIYYGKEDKIDVPAGLEALVNLFENEDPGSGIRLRRFLKEAAYKYEVGVNKLVYKPGRSLSELLEWELVTGVMKLDVFSSISRHVRKVTKNDKLVRMMEFPVLFLGALPGNTPALYSLMNYADMALGTWFPEGGMYEIVKAMVKVAQKQGVEFVYNAPADEFRFNGNSVQAVRSGERWYDADVVISSADYHHTEQALLPAHFRNYSNSYWKKRVMAPSCLIYYVGLNAKIDGGMPHHTLFFDESLDQHATEIYTQPQWPSAPLFYVSLTTKTDPSGAPEGHENMFVLIPVASDLEDTEVIREEYFKKVLDRMERLTGQEIRSKIDYYRSYAYSDFVSDYNSFRGNAYGLANTLLQTANLKPSCKNKKLNNLYYTGQLTVPGPGVPPALISGKVVAEEVCKDFL